MRALRRPFWSVARSLLLLRPHHPKRNPHVPAVGRRDDDSSDAELSFGAVFHRFAVQGTTVRVSALDCQSCQIANRSKDAILTLAKAMPLEGRPSSAPVRTAMTIGPPTQNQLEASFPLLASSAFHSLSNLSISLSSSVSPHEPIAARSSGPAPRSSNAR